MDGVFNPGSAYVGWPSWQVLPGMIVPSMSIIHVGSIFCAACPLILDEIWLPRVSNSPSTARFNQGILYTNAYLDYCTYKTSIEKPKRGPFIFCYKWGINGDSLAESLKKVKVPGGRKWEGKTSKQSVYQCLATPYGWVIRSATCKSRVPVKDITALMMKAILKYEVMRGFREISSVISVSERRTVVPRTVGCISHDMSYRGLVRSQLLHQKIMVLTAERITFPSFIFTQRYLCPLKFVSQTLSIISWTQKPTMRKKWLVLLVAPKNGIGEKHLVQGYSGIRSSIVDTRFIIEKRNHSGQFVFFNGAWCKINVYGLRRRQAPNGEETFLIWIIKSPFLSAAAPDAFQDHEMSVDLKGVEQVVYSILPHGLL